MSESVLEAGRERPKLVRELNLVDDTKLVTREKQRERLHLCPLEAWKRVTCLADKRGIRTTFLPAFYARGFENKIL